MGGEWREGQADSPPHRARMLTVAPAHGGWLWKAEKVVGEDSSG